MIQKMFIILLLFNLVPIFQPTQTNISLQSINQEFGEDWVPENLTSDLLERLVGVLYKGDGSGILEIVFNLIPIIGSNTYADALLIPIFILLFTGVYWKLKRQGYLD